MKKAKPNTAMTFKISDGSLIDEFTVCEFDLNQSKNHFDDWEQAFSSAIEKRTNNSQVSYFIVLSSGYDSGLISCFLNEFEVDYKDFYHDLEDQNEELKFSDLELIFKDFKTLFEDRKSVV